MTPRLTPSAPPHRSRLPLRTWTDDDVAFHTLIDCITSFDVDGGTAGEIVDYVFSASSGLKVTLADAE